MDQLIKSGAFKVAGETEGLDVISNILEHNKDKSAGMALRSVVDYYGFAIKYPIGFALFYSDGKEVIHSGKKENQSTLFDPATIKPSKMTSSEICFANIEYHDNIFQDICADALPGSLAYAPLLSMEFLSLFKAWEYRHTVRLGS